jgi:carboxyl-terminal processing protease
MKRKVIFCLSFLLLALTVQTRAQTTAVAQTPKNSEAELRRQAFETVWTTINEKHFDPTFGGVDWKKVRADYEPKAAAAKTNAELNAVLNNMLGELKLSHFSVYTPPTEAQKAEAGASVGGTIGVEIKMIDGKAVVSRVETNSAAEKAGVKTGFSIEKIDGKSIREIFAPLDKNLTERGENERVKNLYFERTAAAFLEGKPETPVKIEVLNAKNEPQIFDVKRYAGKSEMSEAVGNFPAQPVIFEAKRLDGNIGYIRFNMWIIPQMAKIRAAVKEFSNAKGIVFDLRGNPGGVGGMAPGIAGLLTAEKTSLGSMTSRASEQKFIVYPQPNPFAGRVIVLTDHGSASTSEVFAAGMQENGRAKIIGERTAGAVLPSVFTVLPTGAIFQYVISDYKSPKNVLIEKRGVAPDIEIKQTRDALLQGRDLPLEEAVRQIVQ